jgi:pimeloyl-ACP methyl ester carboxylesterase
MTPLSDEVEAPSAIDAGRPSAAPVIAGRATAKLLPHSKSEISDTGHVVFSSAPEAFLRVVEPFLASLPIDPSVDRR